MVRGCGCGALQLGAPQHGAHKQSALQHGAGDISAIVAAAIATSGAAVSPDVAEKLLQLWQLRDITESVARQLVFDSELLTQDVNSFNSEISAALRNCPRGIDDLQQLSRQSALKRSIAADALDANVSGKKQKHVQFAHGDPPVQSAAGLMRQIPRPLMSTAEQLTSINKVAVVVAVTVVVIVVATDCWRLLLLY